MESYPFDDVTPAPATPVHAAPPAAGSGSSRARKIATGAAIGVAVLATGGVAMAATHSGSTTTQGGPGGGPGGFGPGGTAESGTTGQVGPGGGFGGPPGTTGTTSTTGGTGTATGGTPAAAPTATPTAGTGTGSTGNTTAPQPGGARGFGGPGGPGGLAQALHGTFVVPATSGTGTTTEDLQTGKVTAVSATSIAVTSTDKVAGTFVVNSTTTINHGQSKIGDIKVGDTVTVIAADAGKTAISIDDRSNEPSGGMNGRPGGHGFGGGMPNGTPPSGAPSTTGGEST